MKSFPLILILSLICFQAYAQYPVERSGNRIPGLSGSRGTGTMNSKADAKESLPSSYKDYHDDNLDKMNSAMKEREWLSEDTAWKRAREMDTRQSYERYMSMYPGGAHIAQAGSRLVNVKIDETLSKAHNNLPNIKRIESDDSSPTSTIEIHNNTGYPLTVYYSGEKGSSILIQPDRTGTITLDNGPYKLAAMVPPSHIRPYAGKTELLGGRYEIGFWVVSR